MNTLTFLTNNGDFKLASRTPMTSYQPLIKGLSSLRMGQKCKLYSLTTRKKLIVFPLSF